MNQPSAHQPPSRVPDRARLDLHLHSDRSDGVLTPRALLERCATGRLDVIALTDHDLAPDLTAGWHRVGGRWIRVLHAAEVSGVHEGKELHLLVYFPGEMPSSYRDFLTSRARHRASRYEIARASIGLDGVAPADDTARAGGRSLTRHHLARALVASGHVASVGAAFSFYAAQRHGHVPNVDLTYVDAIRIAREAGGFASWAHPSSEDAVAWTRELAAVGLQALEASRPRLGMHGRAVLARLARKHGLLVTGGSDWHGWHGGAPGQFSFPLREARPFLSALDVSA